MTQLTDCTDCGEGIASFEPCTTPGAHRHTSDPSAQSHHWSDAHEAWRQAESEGRKRSAQAKRLRAQARALARDTANHDPAYDSLTRSVCELVDHRGRGLITRREYLDGIRASNRAYTAARKLDSAERSESSLERELGQHRAAYALLESAVPSEQS
jgi:hypothetical protein